MPVYNYRGVDKAGRFVSGAMDAHDEVELEEKLKGIGFWLVHSRAQKPSGLNLGWLLWWTRVTRRDLIDFCTQISHQIKAGVPLVQALEVSIEECGSPGFRLILEGVLRNIESGSLFYEALEKYPGAFSPQVIGLVRAGELSGKLPETFSELRRYLEWLDHVIEEVRQASIYPAIIVTVVSMFVLFLFTFVIPKFVDLMNSLKVPLPLVTQVIFGVSDFVKGTWWIWMMTIVSTILGIQLGRRFSRKFAVLFDQFKLNLPAFGELNQIIALSRFAHNLSLMYRSGIPILQSLRFCQGLVGNAVMENAIAEIEKGVSSGDTISEALSRHKVFPSLVRRMVVLGETTGKLDEALDHVANYYNDIIPRRIKKIFSLAEPALMLFLIGLVGTVAMSIFLPILSLMGGIKS